jgi:hypothetical protein
MLVVALIAAFMGIGLALTLKHQTESRKRMHATQPR